MWARTCEQEKRTQTTCTRSIPAEAVGTWEHRPHVRRAYEQKQWVLENTDHMYEEHTSRSSGYLRTQTTCTRSTDHMYEEHTRRSSGYLRTRCIGTDSKSRSRNLPPFASFWHSCIARKHNHNATTYFNTHLTVLSSVKGVLGLKESLRTIFKSLALYLSPCFHHCFLLPGWLVPITTVLRDLDGKDNNGGSTWSD